MEVTDLSRCFSCPIGPLSVTEAHTIHIFIVPTIMSFILFLVAVVLAVVCKGLCVDQQAKHTVKHASIDTTCSWCVCTVHQTWHYQQFQSQRLLKLVSIAKECWSWCLFTNNVKMWFKMSPWCFKNGRNVWCYSPFDHMSVREARLHWPLGEASQASGQGLTGFRPKQHGVHD